ncbi:hypothetical protein F8568_037920 [Actinomadura sp. LD22]|uniref:Lipoprotein n=1 Tax=Actinomadura physcomitrii TaxID=2650748 RepID=A0A6I4MK85_9ACTN|nr:hypothetical protein [Actinomadura physcomitrii]MWA06033.1 hypothetical protein [Actinomadura physcomitrii]
MNRAFMLLVVAFAIAGCGGSGGSDAGSEANPAVEQAVKYAQCIRKNGVPNFPDP